jgi:hypothetical protein
LGSALATAGCPRNAATNRQSSIAGIYTDLAATGGGRGVPTADDPSALSVSDGVDFAGTVVPRDGSYFAFDIIGMLVGVYPSRIAAMRALPKWGHA